MQHNGLSKLFFASLTVLALAGCASTGTTTDEPATTDNAGEEATQDSQTQQVENSSDINVQDEQNTGAAANPLLDQTTIYFSFDRSEINPEFKEILNAHAQNLVDNPQAKVILEGHCDERGTVEYNLALGERRANKTKRYLIVQGANPNQIDTVSFGEERPAMIGSNESAWSKNRRAEIKYQAN